MHCSLKPWLVETEVGATREYTVKIPALAFDEHQAGPVGGCAESLCQRKKSSETKTEEFLKKLLSATAKCSSYSGDGIKSTEKQQKRDFICQNIYGREKTAIQSECFP